MPTCRVAGCLTVTAHTSYHNRQALSSLTRRLPPHSRSISIYETCGLQVTPPTNGSSNGTAPLDEQACIDSFNAALNTTCSSDASAADCCNSLSALGGECLAFTAATMAADAQYAELLTAL